MGDGLAEKGAKALFGWVGAKKSEKQQKRAREDQIKLIEQLDWEPEYASKNVPTYQKTKSPVARSYLESMLLGQNPDTTFSGATNAKYKQAAQQRTMDNLYGTMGQRAAESAKVQQETPWKVTAPTRRVEAPVLTPANTHEGLIAQSDLLEALDASGVPRNELHATAARLAAKYGDPSKASAALKSGREKF